MMLDMKQELLRALPSLLVILTFVLMGLVAIFFSRKEDRMKINAGKPQVKRYSIWVSSRTRDMSSARRSMGRKNYLN